MIDVENLRTASLYINNQLLSRGLLRDGQTIDFATTGKDGQDYTVTASRIISIVNDLILRRDRDSEQRESLSTAIRNLRAEGLKHTSDIARLTEKNAEEKRRAELALAAEAALKTQLKSADSTARGLKEDVARMKALVLQTRSACATEVRRRDRQIDTLKKQLADASRLRGSRANPAVTIINVTGDMGPEKDSPMPPGSLAAGDYDLTSETNAFLAKLAQNLSEENKAILDVMHRVMGQLREMSGYQDEGRVDTQVLKRPSCEDLAADLDSVVDHMRKILTNPSFVPIEEVMVREEEIGRLRSGWVKMESRWRDAVHLIDSWRKRMAASGRPVCDEELRMGLRLSPVRVNDVEETSGAPGMGLPAVPEEDEDDVAVPDRSPCPPGQDGLVLVPEPDYDHLDADDATDDGSTGLEDNVPPDNYHVEEADVEMPQHQGPVSPDSSPLPEPPQLSPLRNSASAGNRGTLMHGQIRPRPENVVKTAEEKRRDDAARPKSMRSLPLRSKATATQARRSSKVHTYQERARSSARTSLDDVPWQGPEPTTVEHAGHGDPAASTQQADISRSNASSAAAQVHDTPRQTTSRPTLGRHAGPVHRQSPLTMPAIAAKLAASEHEADAARVRAKLKAVRSTRGGVQRPALALASDAVPKPVASASVSHTPPAVEDVDPVKHDPPSPREQPKRRRERRTSRLASRRSTLRSWELEALISGNAQ